MKSFAIGTFVLAFIAAAGATGWFVRSATGDAQSRVSGFVQIPAQASQEPQSGRITRADGFVGDGDSVSPFDDEHPAIANLEPGLRGAMRNAAAAASRDGVKVRVTAGWRSVRYQRALLDEAIVMYGSEHEARRWVNPPELSAHVTGDAIDVGPTAASAWLSQHGSDYGLCQVYANESWHFELTTEPGGVCPPKLTDASGARVGSSDGRGQSRADSPASRTQ